MAYKVTREFKNSIKAILDKRASIDPQFAEKYHNEDSQKTITECCEYIVGEAFRKKVNAVSPKEIEGWAVHYYDEEKIKVTLTPDARVVVPASEQEIDRLVEAMDVEERERLCKIAQERFINSEKEKLAKEKVAKAEKKREQKLVFEQPSLF